MTLDDVLKYFQLTANAFALGVAGWIYLAYVKSLKAALTAKDEQVKAVEKNITFWKDKAQDLEKKTPEHMEEILTKRIVIREDEINRLVEDREAHKHELTIKTEELNRLKSDLEKAKDVRKGLDLLSMIEDENSVFFPSDLEIEEIGFVSVDSGQLMVTDPVYLNEEWQNEKFKDLRLYQDVETLNVYQYQKDFQQFNEKIPGFEFSVNELIKSGRFEELEVETEKNFSYAGACNASNSKSGFGQLKFKKGHTGAGIALRTVHGDGDYKVYAEKYDGEIVRFYVNLV